MNQTHIDTCRRPQGLDIADILCTLRLAGPDSLETHGRGWCGAVPVDVAGWSNLASLTRYVVLAGVAEWVFLTFSVKSLRGSD